MLVATDYDFIFILFFISTGIFFVNPYKYGNWEALIKEINQFIMKPILLS